MKVKVGIFYANADSIGVRYLPKFTRNGFRRKQVLHPDIANISVSMGVAISVHSIVILKILKKTYKIVLEFLRLIKWKSKFYLFFVRQC